MKTQFPVMLPEDIVGQLSDSDFIVVVIKQHGNPFTTKFLRASDLNSGGCSCSCLGANADISNETGVNNDDDTLRNVVLTAVVDTSVTSYTWSVQGQTKPPITLTQLPTSITPDLTENQVIVEFDPNEGSGFLQALIKLTITTADGCTKDFYYFLNDLYIIV